MSQPDIGWCPCCNRAVVELSNGSCSECFNHTMQIMSVYDHDKELSAMRQRAEAAVNALSTVREEIAAIAAECPHTEYWDGCTSTGNADDAYNHGADCARSAVGAQLRKLIEAIDLGEVENERYRSGN